MWTSRTLCFMAALAALAPIARAADGEDPRRKRGEVKVLETRPADEEEALELAAELARKGTGFYHSMFERGFPAAAGMAAASAEADRAASALGGRILLHAGEGPALSASRHIRLEMGRARSPAGRSFSTAREFFDARLLVFARAAGLAAPPGDLRPILAPGASGKLRAGALGSALLAATELARVLATPRRTEGTLRYVGRTADGGFAGLVYMDIASAIVEELRTELACDGTSLGDAPGLDYNPFASPRYYAHEVAWRDAGARMGLTYQVSDASAHLRDEALIVMGACRFVELADLGGGLEPGAARLMGPLEGAGDVRQDLFSPALAHSAREVARFLFRDMAALHFDPARGAFASLATADAKGSVVDTADAALAALAIEELSRVFPDDAPFRAEARKLLESELDFLEGRCAANGALPARVDLASGKSEGTTLTAELRTASAFLGSVELSGNEKRLERAEQWVRGIEARRFDPWCGLYLEPDPLAATTLGPGDAAALLDMLGAASQSARAPEAALRLRDALKALSGLGVFGPKGGAATVRVRVVR